MKNIFSKNKNTSGSNVSYKPNMINPHHDWKIVLRIFFFLVLILIMFTFYILYKIKNEQIFQVSSVPATPPSPIKEKLLNDITTSFSDKAKKTDELKKNPVAYPDPSI